MGEALKVVNLFGKDEQLVTYIEEFHNELKLNSEHTARAYINDIEQFIKLNINTTELLDLSIEIFKNILNRNNVFKFRQNLIDEGLAPSTVNRKITALREFAKHLDGHNFELDIQFFNNLKALKSSADSYEVLSIPEAIKIAEWFRDNEKSKGYEKFLYTLLAIDTGIRAEALANLTPENFVETDEEVLIKGVDKGNKRYTKKISKEFFQDIKENTKWKPNTKLFGFSAKNRTDMMKRALKDLGWDNRNIVFHSFKKAAVNNAFDITGDIMVAMKTGGHSSVSTTQRYIAEGETFMGAISNVNAKEMAKLDYNDYTKEELVEALEQMSENLQYQVKTLLLNNK